ncbi:MAG: hypothetical protein L6Q69_14085, partial [Zoogloea sp.]|nr:hypothetical protein [Zoogloea sp.]
MMIRTKMESRHVIPETSHYTFMQFIELPHIVTGTTRQTMWDRPGLGDCLEKPAQAARLAPGDERLAGEAAPTGMNL